MFKVYKYIIYVNVLILFGVSGNNYEISDGTNIDSNDTILFFKVKLNQKSDFFEKNLLTLKNLEFNQTYTLKLKKNKYEYILYKISSGTYFFEYLTSFRPKVLNKPIEKYKGSISQNAFKIYPMAINYLGEIEFSEDRIGKQFYIKRINDIIADKKFFYFLNSFSKEKDDLKWLKKNYPKFFNRYPFIKIPILWEQEALKLKASLNITNEFSYGYKYENYGVDENGYKEFKWKMSFKDFENIYLASIYKDIKYEVVSKKYDKNFELEKLQDHITVINIGDSKVKKRFEEKKIYFHFSMLNSSYWKNKLYKVTFYVNRPYEELMKKLTYEYGIPIKSEDKWTWELPKTKIYFYEEENNSCYISYISKFYDELLKANVGKD